jgi:hypothetical protein
MKYMLLIYHDERVVSDEDREHCYTESRQLAYDLNARGQFISSAPLYPTTTATSVRVRDGKRLMTDGPFAETREQLGGYYLIDVPNLDDAVEAAARVPVARTGTVEVRPVIELDGLPSKGKGE